MNNIIFTVFEGTIHALVGRSGSGKSVLLKSIIGAIPKSNYEGLITINGYKAGTTFSKNSLGYSLNIENFPQGLSAYNFLKFLGKTTIISESKLLINLERLLKNFGLWESRN
ncbi:ATP-binding cassette domain-containing protein [Spiroplasma endosymbiont of Cleonymus obscurus]|uniref:ATP-binding cassette domain-containing protein n=1 Tax=Spiroplasma endosymbiont of Cleonymus obscurus TaxID=3066324 RepID=UPI0037DC0E30